MDDVAGCRLIFDSIDELNAFRTEFHRARFKHERKNEQDKYNYIKNPKLTGYRGIHDVYAYDVNSDAGRSLKGLLLEIQYRTTIQHAWATTVEVIGFITESQPKFQQGDKRYQEAMAYASEILARAFEGLRGPYPDLTDQEVVKRFLDCDEELGLLSLLRGLNSADAEVSSNRNTILIFSPDGTLDVRTFRDAPDALRALFDLELEQPGRDIVLVRADTPEQVRYAFKNYFSDAGEFISLVKKGCELLLDQDRIVD
jgi:hypothetical protein